MESQVGNVDAGHKDLIDVPGQIPKEPGNLKEEVLMFSFCEKEIVRHVSHDPTGDNSQRDMKVVKPSRKNDPEHKEDAERREKSHVDIPLKLTQLRWRKVQVYWIRESSYNSASGLKGPPNGCDSDAIKRTVQ